MAIAGYRRVNYYELCRLCTSSEGTKMHIFRDEGRRRQLPTKIQICLPLQVCEDDSLPKIICNHCVEKLESFYDFRESCVNAEAMLESYFTSLRYSEDFNREGKCYVKDDTPPKSRGKGAGDKHHNGKSDGLNSLVQAAGITMETGGQSGTVEGAETRAYTYEGTTETKVEEGAGGERIKRGDGNSDGESASASFAAAGQEMLVEFGFLKDRDAYLRSGEDQTGSGGVAGGLSRSSIAQIGEFLRMKSVCGGGPSMSDGTEEGEEAGAVQNRCDRCGKSHGTPEELQAHIPTCQGATGPGAEGKGGGNYNCDACGKHFKRKEHLLQHRKLHTGERPYGCSACGKSFSRKEHLVRHSVSHTGEKVHACELCGKAFSRRDNLLKHRKTHGIAGPYVCETCGKSFVVKHYYLMHRSGHAGASAPGGERPYRCETCGKTFAVRQYLATHRLRHTRNKPSAGAQAVAGQSTGLSSPIVPAPTVVVTANPTAPAPAATAAAYLSPPPPPQPPQQQQGVVVATGAGAPGGGGGGVAAANELLETYRRLHTA